MGKVTFEDPVHHISGKISKKYRTCYNHKRINGLNFTSVHGERTTPVSAEEKARQERFKVVRLAARSRAMDLSRLTWTKRTACRKARRSSTRPTRVGYSARHGNATTRARDK